MNIQGQKQHDQICDALNGRPDMAAFYKLDASLYPEAYRSGCDYPPNAVCILPEYQTLNGQVIDAQLLIDKWSDVLKKMSWSQGRLKEAAQPDSLPKFNDDQQTLLMDAASALGPMIAYAYRMKSAAQEEVTRLRSELLALEMSLRGKVPDSERWMKHKADELAEEIKGARP